MRFREQKKPKVRKKSRKVGEVDPREKGVQKKAKNGMKKEEQ